METKLYVGNLSKRTTEEDLSSLFSQSGSVSGVEVITVECAAVPKTFAFVEMGSQQDAERAIERLNGAEIKGKTIKVSTARPREKRPEGRSWYNDPPPPIQRKSSPRKSK